MDKIRILIADDIEETRNVIKKILSMESSLFEVAGEAADGTEVLKLIPKVKPDIVLMDINMPELNGLQATEKITEEYPEITVIIMSVQGESEYLKKAMLYGAKEYIIKPFNYDTLINTIKEAYDKNKNRQYKHSGAKEKISDAKVLAFFSSKGGVGKSVLAVNSAVTFSKGLNKKILLIDMDLQFGDVSMMVNQYHHKNMLDMIDENQYDSYDNMRPYFYKYSESLDMLFAPGKPEAIEFISKDIIEKIIKSAKRHYDLIVVDTGINFNDSTLFILDSAETILFVSTMEIVALKNTKLGFKVMQSLGYDEKKVKLVVNRCTNSYGISKKDVEEVFKDNIFAMIPEEEDTVMNSVNKGQPFSDNPKYLKTKVEKAVKAMCTDMAELG